MQPTDHTLNPPRFAGRHSRAEDIRATLEAEIEAGLLCPGAPLDERELALRFGVSRTPVREALQQLAAHELVSIAPRQGAAVARLSVGKVRAMLEYVGELESLAARLAARRGDEALHAALDAGLSLGRRVAATPGAAGYAAANAAFHEAIYQGCRNEILAGHIRAARRCLQRYRMRDFATGQQVAKSLEEHQRIADAIRAGDEQQAAAAMTLHVPAGTTGFAEFLATVPTHFFDGGHAAAS
ncbi:GntR family transcriptional regulator [Cupriavidus necator]|uniref:Transcriptional regulator, GntR family n=1 Tax=Cupriavidus pinatubonensis (strain JMP 134 / LMG 1197) TaxID=264198 RepID=Q46RU4_CUPPJ|nr:GntR family transcriptional regulator [Cupriavidus necator]